MQPETNWNGIPVENFEIGSSTFITAPERGCRLMRWSVKTVRSTREVLYWPGNESDQPFEKVRGGNPILFPFSGRTFDRGKENFWKAPGGRQLPMPRHGFARDGKFEVVARSGNGFEAEFLPRKPDLEAYPFEYSFRVRYTFEELAFTVTLILENRGGEPMPWSAGHHFYFTLPWHEAASRGDYRLNMEAQKCGYHGPDGKLVMARDRESCHDLSDTDLVDRIHWQLRHNRVSFGPRGGEEDVHVIIGEEPVPKKGNALVTWSESETAPFYCIEPWMGPPNAAEHGKGLYWVNPGETSRYQVQVSLY